jgi:light-harvesting complex 1 alpha chain
MWRYWRIVDPRKAIILTGLLIAFISATIHLVFISSDRYNVNSWKTPLAAMDAKAGKPQAALQNVAMPSR